MAEVDPLQVAAAYYASERWEEEDWRRFGRETGTSDLIDSHPRLYRSLSFGDPDYPDAAFQVVGRVLREGVDPAYGEAGRMELLSDSMGDLPEWTNANAPTRTRRLFEKYLAGRTVQELPVPWRIGGELEHADCDRVVNSAPTYQSGEQVSALHVEPGDRLGTLSREYSMLSSSVIGEGGDDRIFIVHGRDEAARNSIRIFTHEVTGIMPTVLADEPSLGRTIIEKFEQVGSSASRVIVVLTPDDVGGSRGDAEGGLLQPRARQNVIFELGYFIGKLGRRGVVVINAGVEIPSDIHGYNYISYPEGNWKHALHSELKATE